MYYHVIERRLKHRLLPHIYNMVPDGSIIYSDELASYKTLSKNGRYTHKTVCHSENEYVREEEEDGFCYYIHINTIEAHNRCLKAMFKNISTRTKKRMKEECAVYIWKRTTDELFFPFITL